MKRTHPELSKLAQEVCYRKGIPTYPTEQEVLNADGVYKTYWWRYLRTPKTKEEIKIINLLDQLGLNDEHKAITVTTNRKVSFNL